MFSKQTEKECIISDGILARICPNFKCCMRSMPKAESNSLPLHPLFLSNTHPLSLCYSFLLEEYRCCYW